MWMRSSFMAGLAVVLGCGTVLAQGVTILQRAPTDRAVPITKETLGEYLKDMEERNLQTLRMIEGGKFNVNIRRITASETALTHPITTDVWYVLEGTGTLTTGGVIEQGRIIGGVSYPLKPGDLVYIPSGLPHGVSGVEGSIAWLNIRWDNDWPVNSPMGAGALPPAGWRTTMPGGGGAPGSPGGNAPVWGNLRNFPLYYGGSAELYFSKERLEEYMEGIRLRNSSNYRMVEGGRFNVNLRRNVAASVETHPQTIDLWIQLAGNATVNTGYDVQDGRRVANTGLSVDAKPGDLFFIPSNHYHGYSYVNPDTGVFWLNIRWDDNYANQ